jgi:hypothetical protein
MLKPKPCQQLVAHGLALSVGSAVCLAFAVPAATSSYSSGSHELLVVLASIAFISGLGFLFAGINRASAGIDYLVAVASSSTHPDAASEARMGEDPPT